MRLSIALLGSWLLLGCSSGRIVGETDSGNVDPDTGVGTNDDAGSADANPIVPGDAMTMDAAPVTKFFLMVTQTPGGNAPMNTWGGVARYDIADDFAPATTGVGIDKSKVADPCGLAFRKRSAELFVGNREGNVGPGSIARFRYDKMTEKFTPNGVITGNGLSRVHQVSFDGKENELFAANRDGGISRFKFDMNGNPIPNGVLTANGWIRGVVVSPDGKRLYATTAGYIIRQFDLSNGGTELATVQVPETNANLHFMSVVGNELYAPAATNGLLYRFKIESDDSLTLVSKTSGNTPISVAFSPSGKELFAAGHLNSDLIDRFKSVNGAWTPTSQILTGWSLGMVLVFPSEAEPDQKMPW